MSAGRERIRNVHERLLRGDRFRKPGASFWAGTRRGPLASDQLLIAFPLRKYPRNYDEYDGGESYHRSRITVLKPSQ